MMAYLQGANWKQVKKTLERLGAPASASDLGVNKEEVVEALELSATLRPERYTILRKLNLSKDGYEKLARTTGVI